MKKTILIFTIFSLIFILSGSFVTQMYGRDDEPKIKTGWTFGALPAISYNSDLGFQYGALVNLFHFGDGTTYPKYRHSIYAEISRFTKGSGVNRLFYDSEFLIPNIRVTSDLSFFTEKAMDFYGFNGYNAVYNSLWEDNAVVSRLFYRHERQTFRFITDFQGPLFGENLRWIAGFGIMNTEIGSVDINALNEGKEGADILPNVPGLYDKYVEWGIISKNERNGGWANHLKFGLVYDTRDNEPKPMKGLWSEVIFFTAPEFFGNGDFGYTKISATHRQYFTIVEDKLAFAYRLNFQGTIAGEAPFFMQPYQISSFSATSNIDGLGGSKTLRGVLRNRVVGDAVAFGNLELRWKFYEGIVFNQNIYLALSGFTDMGRVVREIEFTRPTAVGTFPVPATVNDFFRTGEDGLHVSYGGGFRVAINENFIVAFDYGVPADKYDGGGGLYIGLNWLF